MQCSLPLLYCLCRYGVASRVIIIDVHSITHNVILYASFFITSYIYVLFVLLQFCPINTLKVVYFLHCGK